VAEERTGFLGVGWSFPPAFSLERAAVEMVRDELDIKESIWILLSTSLGERIMLPTYGSNLAVYVFRALTTTLLTEIEDVVATAILNWEPRVDVESVDAVADASVEGKIDIEIVYVIRQTNARSNLVYPYYLQEGSLPSSPA